MIELPQYRICRTLTRPALNRFGIPTKMGMLIFLGTVIFAIWGGRGSPYQVFYYGVCIPLYAGVRGLAEWEPNFFRLFDQWRKTKLVTHLRTGGSRLAAMPCGTPRDPRDVAGAV